MDGKMTKQCYNMLITIDNNIVLHDKNYLVGNFKELGPMSNKL